MYIWQQPGWPNLRWNDAAFALLLGRVHKAQGRLLGGLRPLGLDLRAGVLVDEAFTTSAIEGETLDRQSLQSSVARRLGLAAARGKLPDRHVDGLVEMLFDATRNYDTPLTVDRLKAWQAALFPSGRSGLVKITTGEFRSGTEPMQVVSGPMGRETIHYEAPPSARIPAEVDQFLDWWSHSQEALDGLVRAAVAHFWFVTIHPFEDGNGRIARAVADMVLAQDEKAGDRPYSMSLQIHAERNAYYAELERAQRGNGDITNWLTWFLGCLERAIARSEEHIHTATKKTRFWRSLSEVPLNERQRKVVNRLLDAGPGGFQGGLTNRKYRGMTSTTPETAKRDLAQLVERGILVANPGAGRSTSYSLDWSRAE